MALAGNRHSRVCSRLAAFLTAMPLVIYRSPHLLNTLSVCHVPSHLRLSILTTQASMRCPCCRFRLGFEDDSDLGSGVETELFTIHACKDVLDTNLPE